MQMVKCGHIGFISELFKIPYFLLILEIGVFDTCVMCACNELI